MTTLDRHLIEENTWRILRRNHQERIDAWIVPHLDRRRLGIAHPVQDFMFDYYNLSPAKLRRWHPGWGFALCGDVAEWSDVRGYQVNNKHAYVDESTINYALVHDILHLLERTQQRPAALGCFGRHEWAMVYQLNPGEVRHSARPLRLPPAQIAEVVESSPLRCTHFDAFRFFTQSAKPLNSVSPTRATQADLEQPGCLHAAMDLYKWAYRIYPLVGADLLADCFELAHHTRTIDMRASPYDLTDAGYLPITIETPAGRAEYVVHQREISERAQRLRSELISVIHRATDATSSCTPG